MQVVGKLRFLTGGQEGVFEKVAPEQRLAEDEGGSCEVTWEKCIPGTGKSQCKGREAGVCLVC